MRKSIFYNIKYRPERLTEKLSFLKTRRFNVCRVESSALQLVCPLDSRPVQLIFRGLQVVKEKRALLRDVSGVVKPGELLAVMGPSGTKSSLVLAELLFNNDIISSHFAGLYFF